MPYSPGGAWVGREGLFRLGAWRLRLGVGWLRGDPCGKRHSGSSRG